MVKLTDTLSKLRSIDESAATTQQIVFEVKGDGKQHGNIVDNLVTRFDKNANVTANGNEYTYEGKNAQLLAKELEKYGITIVQKPVPM